MVDNVKTYINETNFPKATTTEITNTNLSTATTPLPATTKLQGKLIIENYPLLERIALDENLLEEVVFINCPNLEFIDVANNSDTSGPGAPVPKLGVLDIEKLNVSAGNPTTNALKELYCGGNKIVKIDFTHCQNLLNFECPENPTLNWIVNIDRVDAIEVINMHNSGPVKVMHETKALVFKSVVDEVKELFGVEHAGKLPMEDWYNSKTGKTEKRINRLQLKKDLNDKIIAVQNPQLKAEKENAEKERDEAQAKLEAQKDYDAIKQQLTAIRSELGLAESATKKQIIDKIKELMNRPTSGCSHTGYDAIKAERDRLKTENAELKNDNKENESVITKKVLTETTNTNWKNWGVKISDDQIKSIQSATSAEKVEEIRNGIIKSEFSKLNDKKDSAFYLNVGLGALTIGSLLILAWVLMRQTNLPEKEPKREKEK